MAIVEEFGTEQGARVRIHNDASKECRFLRMGVTRETMSNLMDENDILQAEVIALRKEVNRLKIKLCDLMFPEAHPPSTDTNDIPTSEIDTI